MSFFDFNTAGEQNDYGIIPKNTVVKVRLNIIPGGYNDPSMGLTGGLATKNHETGSIYIKCEYVVLSGEYAKQKIRSVIGIQSPKGKEWGNMGRSFIKAIINSSKKIAPTDNSQEAIDARKLNNIGELNGIIFIGKVDLEKDQYGENKNVIKQAVTIDSRYWPDSDNHDMSPVHGDGIPIANVSNNNFDDDIPF